MTIRFDGKVAIVTGGGNGLGRQHCLQLAARGAKVVVNDLGGSVDGSGGSVSAAEAVAKEIRNGGGEAIGNGADITKLDQVEAMVAEAKAKWGRVDILINNAGILRDKTFSKMTMDDFKKVVDVHLFGTANCTKAVWDTMREQNYGRILMTSSSSGLGGNFGQSNYGAAKLGLVGLAKTLHHEGAKNNIRVNSLAPTAGTRMTEDLFPEEAYKAFDPSKVAPAALFLVSEDAPSNVIVGAGGGVFHSFAVTMNEGVLLAGDQCSVEGFAALWEAISSRKGDTTFASGFEQSQSAMGHIMAGAKG